MFFGVSVQELKQNFRKLESQRKRESEEVRKKETEKENEGARVSWRSQPTHLAHHAQ
jgi:hypothetical protein